MWHYAVGAERKGPVGQAEIEELLKSGSIDRGTLVWREGMANWLPASQTELGVHGSVRSVDAPLPYTEGRTHAATARLWRGETPTYSPQSLDKFFVGYFISLAVAIVGSALLFGGILAVNERGGSSIGPGLLILGGLIALAATVGMLLCQCKLLYRCWEQVSDGNARTTPGQAVGLLFIPLFNFYWQFVAIYGLAQEMNRVIDVHQIPVRGPSAPLAQWYCILGLCGMIPFVGWVASLASVVLGIMTWLSFKRTAQEILVWRLEQARLRA